MRAENSLSVSHQGEPGIWLLLVAQRSFTGPNIREAALANILRRMHAVTRLLHGSVQRLLDMVSLTFSNYADPHVLPCSPKATHARPEPQLIT
jgi:hypothetical protein